MKWRLSKSARGDIRSIYMAGVRQFGRAQADAYHDGMERLFDALADYPEMARLRTELRPPVRVQPYGAHIIVYAAGEGQLDILRVRHGHENWTEE